MPILIGLLKKKPTQSPASGDSDAYGGRILSEVGSFHLEYYDLAHASNDQHWLDRAFGIRDVLTNTKDIDGLYTNRISRPRQDPDGTWRSQEWLTLSIFGQGQTNSVRRFNSK